MKKESFGDLVDRCFKKVRKHMCWSNEKALIWFRTENPLLGGSTPDDYMARRPEKFERWLDSMIDESTAPEKGRDLR